MHELVINLHMHTFYSDGHASHADLAKIAAACELDGILVTDHNIFVQGPEGVYEHDGRKVLLMIGEEIHDPQRDPQKSHLLVFGADKELSGFSADPQQLINAVRQAGALSFIAHPIDPALPAFGEGDLSWDDWQVQGFTGIELWNGFSELKTVIHSRLQGIYYALFPENIPHGPLVETLEIWDRLMLSGKRIVAIGGSDAHATPMHMGPLRRILLPYDYHFRAINTHLIVEKPLSGDFNTDQATVLAALANGHAFVGNDLYSRTKGFRFTGQGMGIVAEMGDVISARGGVTLQVNLPEPAECLLVKDGITLKRWENRQHYTHITSEPGIYRVEVYQQARGKRRGWIFSNPIYVSG